MSGTYQKVHVNSPKSTKRLMKLVNAIVDFALSVCILATVNDLQSKGHLKYKRHCYIAVPHFLLGECTMAMTMLQLTFCAVLLTGTLGLPFFSEEEANQFLGLKRQAPYLDYWQLSGSQSTLGEQISEIWTALKNTALQYTELGSSVFSTDTAKGHISSYMDLLQQSGAHLKQPRRRRDIHTLEPETDPYCPFRSSKY